MTKSCIGTVESAGVTCCKVRVSLAGYFLANVAGAAMEDLEKMAAQLMTAVRKLPPGQQRQDALREIGRLRGRMYALLRPLSASGSANSAKSKPQRSQNDDAP